MGTIQEKNVAEFKLGVQKTGKKEKKLWYCTENSGLKVAVLEKTHEKKREILFTATNVLAYLFIHGLVYRLLDLLF